MIRTIIENQLGPIKGGKIKRYRRKHLRQMSDRANEELANAKRTQKRTVQWLRSYGNPSQSNR